jgi:hypothetical protein
MRTRMERHALGDAMRAHGPSGYGDALACGRHMGAGMLLLRGIRYVEQDQRATLFWGHDTLPAQEEVA